MTKPREDHDLNDVIFSEHFLQRFIQRTRKKYKRHLERCVLSVCKTCKSLEQQSADELRETHAAVVAEAANCFWSARELTAHELPLLAGRRSANSRYFRHSSLLYVVSTEHKVPIVVTCYPALRATMIQKAKYLGTGNRKTR